MKAAELQIGDWVLAKSPIGLKLERVHVIYTKGIVTESGDPYLMDEIEPIPLTLEILDKNGFKNMGFFGKCEVGDWILLCDTRNVAIFHNEHTDIDIPIVYVHELQHALRMCRIDKEIVL